MSVLNWVRGAGEKIKELLLAQTPASIDAMDIIEIDEMWHYTKKTMPIMAMDCCVSPHTTHPCRGSGRS